MGFKSKARKNRGETGKVALEDKDSEGYGKDNKVADDLKTALPGSKVNQKLGPEEILMNRARTQHSRKIKRKTTKN